MVDLLDIQIETLTPAEFADFDRIATWTCSRTALALLPGWTCGGSSLSSWATTVFRTSARLRLDVHDLTEHLRAVDLDISERTATAMLCAIKSDTFSSRARPTAWT